MRIVRCVLAGPLGLLVMACGTAPVPKIAVEGTTVAIGVPFDFEVGYGRSLFTSPPNPAEIGSMFLQGPALNAGNLDAEDLQRGEIVAGLMISPSGGTPVATLPVRLVTRLEVDPSSIMASSTAADSGEKLVLVDIPLSTYSGQPLVSNDEGQKQFYIQLWRYRRTSITGGSTQFTKVTQSRFSPLEWVGWGRYPEPSAPGEAIPITIRDAQGTDGVDEVADYTPDRVWGSYGSNVAYFSNVNMMAASPTPEFHVVLNGQSVPGAWEVSVNYPRQKMTITGVRLIRPNQNEEGGLVLYHADAPVACTTSPAPGTLKIKVVDPLAAATSVLVHYQLNSNFVSCAERVIDTDVTIASGTLFTYDLNGAAITSITASVAGADFH